MYVVECVIRLCNTYVCGGVCNTYVVECVIRLCNTYVCGGVCNTFA